MTGSDVVFEIVRQTVHPQGWVIVAKWPDGKEEPLVGLFTERHFAVSWIRYQSPIWLAQREAELE